MKRPLLNLIGILTFGFILVPTVLGDCQCQAPEKGDGTRWGGNEMIVVVEERSFRQLRGEIRAPDNRPLEDALVEVFDGAEYLLSPGANSSNHSKQKRLAACRTSANGQFCFRHLRSGAYELRSSISNGWNVTHVHIVLDKRTGQEKNVLVTMHLGT